MQSKLCSDDDQQFLASAFMPRINPEICRRRATRVYKRAAKRAVTTWFFKGGARDLT